MRMAMTVLAVAILAQGAPAMADPGGGHGYGRGQGGGGAGAESAHDRPQPYGGSRNWRSGLQGERNGGRPAREAPRGPAVQPAPVTPQARQAPEPRWRGGEWRGRPEGMAGPRSGSVERGQPSGAYVERAWRPDQQRGGDQRRGDRPHWNGDARRDGGRQTWARRDGDGRTWDRNDDVGRHWSRRDGDRRDWNRNDGRRHDGRRFEGHRYDSDRYSGRGYDGYRRWAHGRYPSVYFSSHRYHRTWSPPVGYFVNVWSFGDVLPDGWYEPEYWIEDPWTYDLPLPPPGYDWVRVGDDALLIEQDTGRVVQVVRDIFW